MVKISRISKKIRQNKWLYKKTPERSRDKKKYGFRIDSNLYSPINKNVRRMISKND